MSACEHCGAPIVPHCHAEQTSCHWMRCIRCHSYGLPGDKWRLFDKGAAFNLYTLKEITVIADADRNPPRPDLPGVVGSV